MRGIPRQAVHQNTKIMNSDRHAWEIAKTNSICAWNTDMYGVDPEKDGAREYYNSIFELYASWVWILLNVMILHGDCHMRNPN